MSGRGETPEKREEPKTSTVDFGDTVYTEEGEPVGTVRGLEASGVFVSTREGVESMSIEHARSGQSFGEAELMWRCMNCGEMGEIEGGLPDTCPSCGYSKEELMYWTED